MVLSVSLGDGYYRVLIHDKTLRPAPDAPPPSLEEVAEAWKRMTGESLDGAQARWTSAFSNAAGLAVDYRRGRVLLAGDAAHETPPLAGWGISVGIQDAMNLGWKLAAVLTGRAPEGLLDTYHAERYPIGEQLLRNTAAASLLYLSGDEMEPLRSVMRELVAYKDAAEHFAGMVSGLSVRYDMGPGEHPLLGLRLSPDRELERPDGTRTRVAELLHAGRGVFIGTAGSGVADRHAGGWPEHVDVVTGGWVPPAGPCSAAHAPLDAVLVRPDGHIAWAAPGGGDLSEALGRWFGSAKPAALS